MWTITQSPSSELEAIEYVDSLRILLSGVGVGLATAERDVLESIPELERPKEIKYIDARRDELLIQRAVGVQWCRESDSFRFKVYINSRPPIATRRESSVCG